MNFYDALAVYNSQTMYDISLKVLDLASMLLKRNTDC